jgi:hypothetical protein
MKASASNKRYRTGNTVFALSNKKNNPLLLNGHVGQAVFIFDDERTSIVEKSDGLSCAAAQKKTSDHAIAPAR